MSAVLVRLGRALLPHVERNHVFVWRARHEAGIVEWPDGYVARFPCSADVCSAEARTVMGMDGPAFRNRLRRGDLLGVITCGDEIVHRSLLQIGGDAAVEGDRRALRLTPRQGYIHWCQTAEGHRGLALYPKMLATIAATGCHTMGLEEIFIACRQNNVASMRGILKAGFVYHRSSVAVGVLGGRVARSRWYVAPVRAA